MVHKDAVIFYLIFIFAALFHIQYMENVFVMTHCISPGIYKFHLTDNTHIFHSQS